MKKFLLGALVAVTTLFMASCKSGGSSQYTVGGPEPTIDYEAGTVNGKAYDNKTEYCWEVTMTGKESYGGISGSYDETVYIWGTEFYMVSVMEKSMWTIAQANVNGVSSSASYSYKKNSAKDSESCESQNKDDEDY